MSEDGEPPESGKPTEVPQPVAGDDRRGPIPVEAEEGLDEPGSGEVGELNGTGEAGERENGGEAVVDDVSPAAIATQRDEYLDALRRLQADFENYKKRILKQQTEHLERAAEGLVEKLLPVLDTFDMAIAHGGEGIDQVQGQLMAALEKEGLERIDPVGKPFDPNESDAVAHEPGEGDPVVSEVMRTGYRFKGKLLRPAMVKVKG
jgi:molecular chaperone GrpE